ncbi:MAG: L-threonylcarbamoyladenylate synthase [Methanomassiliicoccaceae archaeon]|nr:L-threonylcarbamoyladenylate synthase [Methanomassiliicoccaceae archaeon]
MKIAKCDCKDFSNPKNEELIKQAAKEIAAGNLIVYPTETVYGIGADIYNEVAAKNVFRAKNRPFDMALSVAVSDRKMMEKIAVLDENADKLVKAFLPGPLTLIIEKRPEVPDLVTSMSKKVGIRMPDHPIALSIIKKTGPIVATSANLHSHPDSTDIDSAVKDLGSSISMYIDAGPSKLKRPSTIVWIMKGEVEIVRQGAITIKQIEDVLNA